MGFWLPIIFGAIFLAVKASKNYSRRITDAWSGAATKLGMSFEPGSLMQSKAIRGLFQGNEVKIDTVKKSSGKHNQTFTRYRINYPTPLGLGLSLAPRGFFADVATFLGAQDINTGDSEFDAKVVVKGKDPARVVDFLNAERREEILSLLRRFPGSKINDQALEWRSKGSARDPETIVNTVLGLSSAATRFGKKLESSKLPGKAAALAGIGAAVAGAGAAVTRLARAQLETDASFDEPAVSEDGERAAPGFDSAKTVQPVATAAPPAARQTEPPASQEPEPPVVAVEPPVAEAEPAAPQKTAPPAPPLSPDEVPATGAADGLDATTVCSELFTPKTMSFEAKKLFEERYKERLVRWSGVLRRASAYRLDLHFDGGPGTKATFDLGAHVTGAFGRTVQAIVQLPPEAAAALGSRIGERISFEGRLANCDALIRNFYVADARLVPDGGS